MTDDRRRRYMDLPDPEGERYDDGSYDFIIAAEWPARYPTRNDHIEIHAGGFDVDLNEQQLRWLLDNGPTLLRWLRDARHAPKTLAEVLAEPNPSPSKAQSSTAPNRPLTKAQS